MSRGTSIQGQSAGQETEVDLLRMMAAAPSLTEQRAIGARLAAYRAERAATARAEREVDLSVQAVEQLYPTAFVGPGVRTTAASDWLGEVDDPQQVDLAEVSRQMMAAASVWYRRVPEAVRAEPGEFAVQAQGMAAREASRHGLHAKAAGRAFLDHIGHLYGRPVVANEVPQLPSQFPPGSGLPPAVDNPATFDESLWGPAGPSDPGTAQGPPSLSEGGPVAGDQAMSIENPTAFDTHDAEQPGVRPSVDYLDGTQTAPGWGSGLTTMTSLVAGRAQQVLAEIGPGAPGVTVEPHPSSAQDQLTPSQQEGGPVEGDVAPTGAPPVELSPHDSGPGNGPAVDEWDGQQYPFGAPGQAAAPTAQPMASRRPLNAIAATVQSHTLPSTAWPFLAALRHLRDTSEAFGAVSGRAVVEALLRTGGAALPSSVVAELRGHLVRRQAGDLPPWLKGKDDDSGDGDKDDKDDDSDSDDDSDESDDSDKDDDSDDSSDDDSDDDDDKDGNDDSKKTSAFRARVTAGLAARGQR